MNTGGSGDFLPKSVLTIIPILRLLPLFPLLLHDLWIGIVAVRLALLDQLLAVFSYQIEMV